MIWIAAVENTVAKEVSVTKCKPFFKLDEWLAVFTASAGSKTNNFQTWLGWYLTLPIKPQCRETAAILPQPQPPFVLV